MFAMPWALVLIVPAALAWWRWFRHGHGRWWRAAIMLVLVLAASRPEIVFGRGGSDVVVLFDRSLSMADGERARQDELLGLIADQRRHGDRLAVIAIGDRPMVAQGPLAHARPRLADAAVDADGSDLASALETALAVIPPGRSARLVLHSDGEATGMVPTRAAARLAAAGIPVDVLPVLRPPAPDAAILSVEVPGLLRLGESYIGAVRIMSDTREERRWRITRSDTLVAEGRVRLEPLRPSVVTFADRPARAGLVSYVVELEGAAGFARPAQVDPARLLATLRSSVPEALLQGSDLEQVLSDPAVAATLTQLADPAQREAALALLRPQLAAILPAVVVDLAVGRVRQALAAAVVEDDDRQPLNNRAHAAIRVAGGERVLVIGGDGTPGNVSQALDAAGLVTTLRAPGPVTLGELAGVAAVVLDNVPADALGATGLTALAQWTEHLGGGLVMLGGRRSFGAGGYRRSPVEDVLPVTLELRDEHRKLACSIAIAIDVSGSMMATVADGRTKLEIAAEGAAAVVDLLGPRDRISVHAVDSRPLTVVPMQSVTDRGALTRQIIGMQPGGGGIFVYEALAACAQDQLASTTGTRHIILFADAADAEEPGDYMRLLSQLTAAGITVSCIGLGSDRDADANLLIDVARRGGGRCTFAEAAEDIPRLFAQETVLVARSAWVDGVAPLRPLAGVELLLSSAALAEPWPSIPGYNLTYARERSDLLAQAHGDPVAPGVAAWRIGTGRAVAVPFSCDDVASSDLLAWQGYVPLLAGVVRWAAGGDDQEAIGRVTATRSGNEAILRIELDPAQRERWPARAPMLALVGEHTTSAIAAPLAQPVDDGVWEARHRLRDQRAIIPAADLAGQAVLGPALCLPYSAEAEPRFERDSGLDILTSITRTTGGRLREDVLDVFANPPSAGTVREVTPWLIIAAAVLLVLEIAVRRLRLGGRRSHAAPAPAVAGAPAPVPTASSTPNPTVPSDAPPPPPDSEAGLHEALRRLRRKR